MTMTADIEQFIASVRSMQNAVAAQEDVPGWRIREAFVGEVQERIAFVMADSKVEERDVPFILPQGTETVVAVVEGCVQIGGTRRIEAHGFWTVHADEAREIRSISDHSKIVCMFFRGGVGDGRIPNLSS